MSNRTEILLELLKQNLYASSHPFTKRIIIVPSAAMKSWVTLELAKDRDIGIAAGLDIGYVEPSLNRLYQLLVTNKKEESCEPTELELAFAVENELLTSSHPSSLMRYIAVDNQGKITKRSTKRAIALADSLAKTFLNYGLYGGELVKKLCAGDGWQEKLWAQMEGRFTLWNYPSRKFQDVLISNQIEPSDIQIHVFGLSYLAPVYHRFLLEIGKKVPVTYYLLSPCQKFWSDIVSDKERLRAMKYWEKEGLCDRKSHDLDHYLRDANPLLANFGRLGREMALMVEEQDSHLESRYALPQSIANCPAYENEVDGELEWEEGAAPLTLLDAVQADIALLRTPQESSKIDFPSYDGTIQLHAAPRPIREVEVVRDTLLAILDKHRHDAEPITPGDIIVMASNLSIYEPYIHTVFEDGECPLDIQLMDVKIPSENSFVAAFLQLLAIPFSRWDVKTLLQLFGCEPFQRRHGLTFEDLTQIAEWIKKSRIAWGGDHAHRSEMMERDHGIACSDLKHGTWEDGIDRLLDGLISEPTQEGLSSVKVDPSDGDLLGKWIYLLRSLKEDMKPLVRDTVLTIGEWIDYLSCLCEGYLLPKGEEEEYGQRVLKDQLQAILKAGKKLEEAKFPYRSIKKRLETALCAQTTVYKESNLNAVRFCSLLPMRAVPAKVIVLMGMGDTEFPRQEPFVSFNLMHTTSECDYSPSQTEFDRYLFLEALLSARRYFIMSYTFLAPGESQELLPSLLANELIEYIDKAYHVNAGPWLNAVPLGQRCLFKHPFDRFNEGYFTSNSRFKSYSKIAYKEAQAYYLSNRQKESSFIADWAPLPAAEQKSERVDLTLNDLSSFAKNPLKIYFNKSLDLFLNNKEDRLLKDEEDLLISYIDFNAWIKEAISCPLEEVVNNAIQSSAFPTGPFAQIEKERLQEEITALKENLQSLEVDDHIYSIEFNDRYQKPIEEVDGWKLPPLKIFIDGQGETIISGKIKGISPKGIIFYDKKGTESLIKNYPSWLVFASLIERDNLPFAPNVLLVRDGASLVAWQENLDPQEELKGYLELYFEGLCTPAPLAPDCAELFLNDKGEKVEELLSPSPGGYEPPSYDPYLTWLKRTSPTVNPEELKNYWQKRVQAVFKL